MKKPYLNKSERFFLLTDTYYGAGLRLHIAIKKLGREIKNQIESIF